MPLFDEPVDRHLLWPLTSAWPRRRARTILKQFQTRWPELTYDMDLAVELANAQAFLDQGVRRIRLYGGLVRHRRIGAAGLAVALAHELARDFPANTDLPKFLEKHDRESKSRD